MMHSLFPNPWHLRNKICEGLPDFPCLILYYLTFDINKGRFGLCLHVEWRWRLGSCVELKLSHQNNIHLRLFPPCFPIKTVWFWPKHHQWLDYSLVCLCAHLSNIVQNQSENILMLAVCNKICIWPLTTASPLVSLWITWEIFKNLNTVDMPYGL